MEKVIERYQPWKTAPEGPQPIRDSTPINGSRVLLVIGLKGQLSVAAGKGFTGTSSVLLASGNSVRGFGQKASGGRRSWLTEGEFSGSRWFTHHANF